MPGGEYVLVEMYIRQRVSVELENFMIGVDGSIVCIRQHNGNEGPQTVVSSTGHLTLTQAMESLAEHQYYVHDRDYT